MIDTCHYILPNPVAHVLFVVSHQVPEEGIGIGRGDPDLRFGI
jgi:hypothetical protein